MRRRVRRQPPERLDELTLGADLPAAAGLVPGNRDMHEALEEVALRGGCGAPGELALLARGEGFAAPDGLNSRPVVVLEFLRRRPGRRRSGAGWRGRSRSGPF